MENTIIAGSNPVVINDISVEGDTLNNNFEKINKLNSYSSVLSSRTKFTFPEREQAILLPAVDSFKKK